MAFKITTRPHETTKMVFGKAVKVSFGQEYVDWEDDKGGKRHIGYLSLSTRFFSGLTGFPLELGEQVAAELSKQKGYKVSWAGAPTLEDEHSEREDEDDDD